MAVAYLAIPFALILLSAPRLSFYLLILVNYIYAPIILTGLAVHPGDICSVVFIGSVAISWLLRGNPLIDHTRLDFPFWALIAATIISGIFAHKPELSLVPVIRIILIYLAYRAFYSFAESYGASRMTVFYVYALTLFSLFNFIMFLTLGGTYRVFGVAGIAFETLSMIGVPLTLVCAIWSETKKKRIFFCALLSFNVLAAISTMSRGLLLTIALSSTIFLWVSYRKAGRMGLEAPRKYIRAFLFFLAPLAIISIVAWGIFVPVAERFQEISLDRPMGTILLRLSLWRAAIDGFLTSPFTGIGIGNFRMIDSLLPYLKFDPVRYYITGMTSHNVFLQYLCETGIIGAAAFLWLAYRAFSSAVKIMRQTVSADELVPSMAAFVGALVIFITAFYMRAWTWGQEGFVFAFTLSLVARQYHTVI